MAKVRVRYPMEKTIHVYIYIMYNNVHMKESSIVAQTKTSHQVITPIQLHTRFFINNNIIIEIVRTLAIWVTLFFSMGIYGNAKAANS